MSNYTLLPIPLKQSFANSGIKQRVPYQLPAADDDLNWLEGFTDAYQRPVISDNLGEKSGRYVRMGQINQILENVSQAFLNIKQSLDNVSETIDKSIKVEIDKVIADANSVLNNRKGNWLQTSDNQNCAGLKNFRDININNFKTIGNAVANLEWCNGVSIQNANYRYQRIDTYTTVTISQKSGIMILTNNNFKVNRSKIPAVIINNIPFIRLYDQGNSPSIPPFFAVRNKDVISYSNKKLEPGNITGIGFFRRSTWQGS